MENQYVQYPYKVEKSENAGYIVTSIQANTLATPTTPIIYVFASLADLTYWMGLNEQSGAARKEEPKA